MNLPKLGQLSLRLTILGFLTAQIFLLVSLFCVLSLQLPREFIIEWRAHFLWALLPIIGILLIMVFLISAWITNPIRYITQVAEEITQGHLDRRIHYSHITEINQLIDAFNSMIEQLKQSFESLQESEETNRAIINAIPDMMIRTKRDGTYTEIVGTDRLREVSDSKQFSPGRNVYDSLPPDLARLRMFYIEKALQTGQLEIYEQKLTFNDQIQYEEVRIFVLGEDEVLIMVRDITDQKQNEKLQRENVRLTTELDMARQIQQMILPKPEELKIDELDIVGYMHPATEVGGDYYDVLVTDDLITIGIGDVTGHGLESGILMLMTQTAVRTLKEVREQDPVKFLDTLNRTIYKNLQRMNSDRNLTLSILTYRQGKLMITGQHEEVILVRENSQIQRIDTIDLGFPIGLDLDIVKFISHVLVDLNPGDGLVLYTDGISEAENIHQEQYGIERLCHTIQNNWHKAATDIKQDIIQDLRTFIGNQEVFDDITLLIIKRKQNPDHETLMGRIGSLS